MIGYVGRINDHDLERIDEWNETANYKGSDYIGKIGVELSYERELHGGTGVEEVEVDSGGRAVRTLSRTPPVSGNNLRLALDINLQKVAEEAFGDRRGALVAIDPATGEILAFVSRPGFDPNLFVDGIDPATWEQLNDSPDKPLLNRPLRGAYPPGSTIKPYLALAALTSGKRTATQTIFDPATTRSPGSAHRFRDDKPGGHGYVDMTKSIVASCDTYYYMLAGETDIDDTYAFMSQFGLRPEDRHRSRGRAAGRAAVARLEARALLRQQLPRGAPQVVSGRHDLGRHRPGIQRLHAAAAGAGDRDHRQRRRRDAAARGQGDREHPHRRAARVPAGADARCSRSSRRISPSSRRR